MATAIHKSSRGVWFAGSQNAANFCQPYDTVWLQQFFFSHLLERRVEWLDAGFASEYCSKLVAHGHRLTKDHPERSFATSWVEQALRTGTAVPCVREGFSSLGDLVESMSDGTWGLGTSPDEIKKLADRYRMVADITLVGWNEGRSEKIIFSEVLKDRITRLFADRSAWEHQPDTGLWEFIRQVGRPALQEGLALTEAGGHRGLRVTDFGSALHDRLFPGDKQPSPPSLSQVVERARQLPEGARVWALCKLVSDMYSDNFAGLTTKRQFALSVDFDTRRVILGRGPIAADRPVRHRRLTALTSFQFPSVKELLSVDPWRLEEIRGTARHPHPMALAYFNALDQWRANDSVDAANALGERLRLYCQHICRSIDPYRVSRPWYVAASGAAGSLLGAVLGSIADHAITQADPDESGAIGYFLVGAGAVAGLGLAAIADGLAKRATEARVSGDRRWDMDGSSQPTGTTPETDSR